MVALMATGATEEGRQPELSDAEVRRRERAFNEFKRVLVGWGYFTATGRMERPSFAEGGGIEHRAMRTEAGFCEPVVTYAHLGYCWLRVKMTMGEFCGELLYAYWHDQMEWRPMKDRFRAGQDTIETLLKAGTKRLAEYYTQLPDADVRVSDWWDDRKGKPRDTV